MLFSRPLIIESTLPTSVTRARVRSFAVSRELPELEAFRRRQLIGWRLSKADEDGLFQPEYGDTLTIDGMRLIALVEPAIPGSRIRGYVVLSALTRTMARILISTAILTAMAMFWRGQQPLRSALAISLAIIAGTVFMIRYRLRLTDRSVQDRLRQCLEASEPRLAA